MRWQFWFIFKKTSCVLAVIIATQNMEKKCCHWRGIWILYQFENNKLYSCLQPLLARHISLAESLTACVCQGFVGRIFAVSRPTSNTSFPSLLVVFKSVWKTTSGSVCHIILAYIHPYSDSTSLPLSSCLWVFSCGGNEFILWPRDNTSPFLSSPSIWITGWE